MLGVEAAGNLLLFQQSGLAGVDGELEDGCRADERLVGIAVGCGVEVAVDLAVDLVGGIGEADLAGCSWQAITAERKDAQHIQSPFAVVGDEEVAEEIEAFERSVGLLGDDLSPVFAARRNRRYAYQAEALGCAVGLDVEESVAVVDAVLLVVDARGDEAKVGGRRGRVEKPGLAGGVASGFEQ